MEVDDGSKKADNMMTMKMQTKVDYDDYDDNDDYDDKKPCGAR